MGDGRGLKWVQAIGRNRWLDSTDAHLLVIGWCVRASSVVVAGAVRWCLLKCITARPLVISSKTKPCQFSSVWSLCAHLNSWSLNCSIHSSL